MYVGAKRRKGRKKDSEVNDGMHITRRMTVVDPDFWGTLHTAGGLLRLRLVTLHIVVAQSLAEAMQKIRKLVTIRLQVRSATRGGGATGG